MKIEHFMKKNEVITKAYSFLNSLQEVILTGKVQVIKIEKSWDGDDFRFILNVKKGEILVSHIEGTINFYDNLIEINFSFPLPLREEEEKIKEVLTSKIKESLAL